MGKTIGMVVIGAFWIAALFNLVTPFAGETAFWVNVVAAVLALAHIVECAVFSKQIHEHHDKPIVGYLLVFLFGVLHAGQWQKGKS